MKRSKFLFCILIILTVFIISSNFVFADNAAKQFQDGLANTGENAGYSIGDRMLGGELLPAKIGKIIKAILSFLGVIFLVLMIYGGYTWMMAGGNEQQVSKARSIIINSIIGLIIIMAAWAITYFAGVFWSHMSAR